MFSVKVNPIYKDVTFGILGAGKSATYAADYHLKDNGDPERNKIEGLDGVPGFTVSALGYKAGFGFNGQANAQTSMQFLHTLKQSLSTSQKVLQLRLLQA